MEKNLDPRIPYPISRIIFPSFVQFFGLNILKFFVKLKFSVADPDPGSGAFHTPGWWIRDGKIRNRDKHPGSATLGFAAHSILLFSPAYEDDFANSSVRFTQVHCSRRASAH
jgi:hypothetical protein